MKKEVKKYTVVESATESDIRSIGMNIWFRSKKNVWYSFLVFVVILFSLSFIDNLPRLIELSCDAIIGLYGIYYCYGCWKSGREYFNKVKDLPEPIDLREIK